jgi:enoyl-CoA hydratase/carnithine racemase
VLRNLSFDAALDIEAERLIRASMHADHTEAVRAFVDKRAPNFATHRQK